jgi:hypothetical protein
VSASGDWEVALFWGDVFKAPAFLSFFISFFNLLSIAFLGVSQQGQGGSSDETPQTAGLKP